MLTSKTIFTALLGLSLLVGVAELASLYSSKSSQESNSDASTPSSIEGDNKDPNGKPLTVPPYQLPNPDPEIENPEPVPGYPGISVGNNSLIESGWNQIGPTPELQKPEEDTLKDPKNDPGNPDPSGPVGSDL